MLDWDDVRPLLFTVLVILVLVTYYIHASGKIVNLEIPVECIKHVEMLDCDVNVHPPKCVSAKISYRPASCPIIHLVDKP